MNQVHDNPAALVRDQVLSRAMTYAEFFREHFGAYFAGKRLAFRRAFIQLDVLTIVGPLGMSGTRAMDDLNIIIAEIVAKGGEVLFVDEPLQFKQN